MDSTTNEIYVVFCNCQNKNHAPMVCDSYKEAETIKELRDDKMSVTDCKSDIQRFVRNETLAEHDDIVSEGLAKVGGLLRMKDEQGLSDEFIMKEIRRSLDETEDDIKRIFNSSSNQ